MSAPALTANQPAFREGGRPMAHITDTSTAWTRQCLSDRRQYRLLFALCFSILLVVALATRLLPRGLRPLGSSRQRMSVLEEARAATDQFLPFAFMG
jgi:hypothetical protein